jgi:CRP-like cAMP-binding protein
MAERQRMAFAAHRSHIFASGPQRLAGLLLDLAARQSADAGELTVTLPLSQEELASLIGASRSTVTRALRDWRSRQIIGADQRPIVILDGDRLLRIAGRAAQQAAGTTASRERH